MRQCVQIINIYQDISTCYYTDKALDVSHCATLLKCLSNCIPLILRPLTICILILFLLESLCFLRMQLHLQCKATVNAVVLERVCCAPDEILHRQCLLFSSFSLLWGCCVSQLGIIDLHGERYRIKPPNSPVISISRSLNQVLS